MAAFTLPHATRRVIPAAPRLGPFWSSIAAVRDFYQCGARLHLLACDCWRATSWELVQHFLAQQPEQMRSEDR